MFLTVLVLTYNHGKSIGRCLESILAQKTGYPYKIVVADDCSPDETVAEIRRVQAKAPERFEVIARTENVGMCRNFRELLERAVGDCFMVCEGDDWWHDPDKIQRQLSYMEEYPACSVLYSDFDEYFAATGETVRNVLKKKGLQDAALKMSFREQLFEMRFWHATCTICGRTEFLLKSLRENPLWQQKFVLHDVLLRLAMGSQGEYGFLPESLATYQINPPGVSASRLKEQKKVWNLFYDDWTIRSYFAEAFFDKEERLTLLRQYMPRFYQTCALGCAPEIARNVEELRRECGYAPSFIERLNRWSACSQLGSRLRRLYGRVRHD